ncbi:Gfo/Idh/MocA family protein [Arsenicicoccus sp. oral taxon 190]|uniref:Gfo/Idh/MocA family protein n=1 Tax=Arsenicicoccus sp. oral taxon 190 TaxID=1658671 RepID=UPI00067A0E3C|nr:Gfo/Idh/MocA family oxidoreductase [Arsenicicoccus sp. oral taxon 190]AKT51842.1 oxidoreductase [Arsenicicoccus sp. oral taxon 190]
MIRIATIGTSVITETFLGAARGRVAVSVVHSRDPQRGAHLARTYAVPATTSDLDALLARDDVDAVYVASPNSVHPEQVRACLEAGRHVLAEKPLAPTGAEAQELFALAQSRGLVLLEAMRSAFDPGTQAVRELLPLLGQVRRVSFCYHQRSSRYDRVLAGERVNVFDPAMAGGALLDLGVYCVRPLVDLFGMPERVTMAQVEVTTGADGAGVVLATYPGMVADLSYSKITRSSLPSVVEGELGTLTIDHVAAPRELVVELLDGTRRDVQVRGEEPNLGYEIDRFAELVESGDLPVRETEGSLLAARVVDLARGL